MLGGVVQGETDEPRMQLRLVRQETDPLFLAPVKFPQASDNFPHIRADRERGTAVMGRTSEDDSRIVPLLHALNDELIEQRCRAGALLGSMRYAAFLPCGGLTR